jgi:hypothetical protein
MVTGSPVRLRQNQPWLPCAALANELTARGTDLAWFVETAAILRDEYFAERYPGWSGEACATRPEAEQFLKP